MRLPVTAGHRPFLLRGHDLPAFTQPTPMEGVLEQFRSVSLELAGEDGAGSGNLFAPDWSALWRRFIHQGSSAASHRPAPWGGNRDRRVGG